MGVNMGLRRPLFISNFLLSVEVSIDNSGGRGLGGAVGEHHLTPAHLLCFPNPNKITS